MEKGEFGGESGDAGDFGLSRSMEKLEYPYVAYQLNGNDGPKALSMCRLREE